MFEYLSDSQARAVEQQAQNVAFISRNWLLLVAAVTMMFGCLLAGLSSIDENTSTDSSGHLWWKETTTTTTPVSSGTRLTLLLVGLALVAVSAVCVIVYRKRARRASRLKNYLAILRGVEVMRVEQIAAITGFNSAVVFQDLQRLIESGLLEGCYIDYQSEQVHNRNYVPQSSHKTVLPCGFCGTNNEVIVGVTKACISCGQFLSIRAQPQRG